MDRRNGPGSYRTEQRRSRWKLVTALLTTYGYGLLGLNALQSYLETGNALNVRQVTALALGVALQALAIYIVPRGESHAAT